ncbi:hypothetical protein TGCAST_309720 [Toxoplasma gondii CAST]|uniref:Uncharacterized protein n=1 Tax=Toxoplasma gondii CAST TaxID=943122 RepID=A0A3R8BXX0_TOXGO|nr:hypothetical protein TGCAST_309720 [Toxoplasma gondii CAST]
MLETHTGWRPGDCVAAETADLLPPGFRSSSLSRSASCPAGSPASAVLSSATPLLECMYTSWGGVGPLSAVDQEVYEVDRCKALAARARLLALAQSSRSSCSGCSSASPLEQRVVSPLSTVAEERWQSQRCLRGFAFAFVLERLLAAEAPLDWLETVAWEEALAFFVECSLKEKRRSMEVRGNRAPRQPEKKRECVVSGNEEAWELRTDQSSFGEATDTDGRKGGHEEQISDTTLLRPPPVLPLMQRFSRRFWFFRNQNDASAASVPSSFPSFCSVPDAEKGTPSHAVSSVHSLPAWLFFFFEELASFLLFVLQMMQRLQQRGGVYVHLTSDTWTRRYRHLHFCLEKVHTLRQRQDEESDLNRHLLPLSSSSASSACTPLSAPPPPLSAGSLPLSLPPLHHLEPSLCQFFPETSLTAPHSFWLLYDSKLCRWLVTRDSLPVREVYVHSVAAPRAGTSARPRRAPSLTAINTAREEALFYLSLCGVGRSEEEISQKQSVSSCSPLDEGLIGRLVQQLQRRPDDRKRGSLRPSGGDEQGESRQTKRGDETKEQRREETDAPSCQQRRSADTPCRPETRRFSSALQDGDADVSSVSACANVEARVEALSPRRQRSGQESPGGQDEPEVVLEEGDEEEERRAMLALSSSLRKTCRKRVSIDSTSSGAAAMRSVSSKRRRALQETQLEPGGDACGGSRSSESAERDSPRGATSAGAQEQGRSCFSREKENRRESENVCVDRKLPAADAASWGAREAAWLAGIFEWRDEKSRDKPCGEDVAARGRDGAGEEEERASEEELVCPEKELNDATSDHIEDEALEGKGRARESPNKRERRQRASAASVASVCTSFPSSRCTSSVASGSSWGDAPLQAVGRDVVSHCLQRGSRESLELPGFRDIDVSRTENLSGGRCLVGSRFRNAFFSDSLLAFARQHSALLPVKPPRGHASSAALEATAGNATVSEATDAGGREEAKKIFTEKEILRVVKNYMRESCKKKGKKHFFCDDALKRLTGVQTLPMESEKLLHALKAAKLVTHFMIT